MSPMEHHVHELVNWIRAHPQDAAAHYGTELNAGLHPGTINDTPKQPLARNSQLREAVQGHLQDMQTNNFFRHEGSDGSSYIQRIEDAGIERWQVVGENLAWGGTTAPLGDEYRIAEQLVAGWFESPGHRETLFKSSFHEVGTAREIGPFTDMGITYNAMLLGQNFATRQLADSFITGIACEEQHTRFDVCDVTRAIKGATVTISSDFAETVQLETGEYGEFDVSLPDGVYDVRIEAAGYDTQLMQEVTINGRNVGIRFVPPPETPWQNPANQHDVNADGQVTSLDALVVINAMNNGLQLSASSPGSPYYDTTGDNLLSPADVLLVINFINRQRAAEGEAGYDYRSAADASPRSLAGPQATRPRAAGEPDQVRAPQPQPAVATLARESLFAEEDELGWAAAGSVDLLHDGLTGEPAAGQRPGDM